MITYKGQKTVIGKRFIYEGEVLKYTGKIYGDSYNFVNEKGIEYVLSESDLSHLEEYALKEEAHIINDISGNDKAKEVIIDYTEKELALLSDLIAGKSSDVNALNDLYQKEIEDIKFLNKYDMPIVTQDTISLEAQQSYLNDVNRNVSDRSIINLIASLQNFIASNKKGGEDNGNN